MNVVLPFLIHRPRRRLSGCSSWLAVSDRKTGVRTVVSSIIIFRF